VLLLVLLLLSCGEVGVGGVVGHVDGGVDVFGDVVVVVIDVCVVDVVYGVGVAVICLWCCCY